MTSAPSPLPQDLQVLAEGDLVRIGRPSGLALSPASVTARVADAGEGGAPKAAGMPGLIDETWAKTGPGGFMPRYAALTEAAAAGDHAELARLGSEVAALDRAVADAEERWLELASAAEERGLDV